MNSCPHLSVGDGQPQPPREERNGENVGRRGMGEGRIHERGRGSGDERDEGGEKVEGRGQVRRGRGMERRRRGEKTEEGRRKKRMVMVAVRHEVI